MLFSLMRLECASEATEFLKFFQEMKKNLQNIRKKGKFQYREVIKYFHVQYNQIDQNISYSLQTKFSKTTWKFLENTKEKCSFQTLFCYKKSLPLIDRRLSAMFSEGETLEWPVDKLDLKKNQSKILWPFISAD